MTGRDDDIVAGLVEPDRRRSWTDDAAILEFDFAAGGARPATDPAEKARRLVQRARERYEAGEYHFAVGLADRALAIDASYLPAWRWKTRSLIRLRNLEGAIAELTRARRTVRDAEAVAKVDEMLDACRRHLTDRPIADARRELRDGHPRQAVTILEKCANALSGDEEFEARLTYARERAEAAESRAPVADTTRLTQAALQRVLAWLCQEEMAAGDGALGAEDYTTAARSYARARKRDERHCAAALGEATAAFALARVAMVDLPPKWAGIRRVVSDVARMLRHADSLAQRAAADRTLADDAAALRKAVADRASDNDALRRRADKILAVNDCIDSYNAVLRQYHNGAANWLTASNLLTSFPPVEARAHRLLKKYGPDDPDVGEALTDLTAAVVRTRKSIRW